MGIWTFLNPLNWFRRRRGDDASTTDTPAAPEADPANGAAKTDATTAPAATKPAAKTTQPRTTRSTTTAKTTATTARSTATPAKTTTKPRARATSTAKTCAALTAAGSPCKRTARDGSKYCASHKGYRAPAKTTATTRKTAPKTAAKTTASKTGAKKATSTTRKATTTKASANGKAKANGAAKKTTRRVHVTHNGYKLYQKGNRFYFSKKTQAEVKGDGAEPVYELPKNREIKVTQNGLPVLKSK